MRFLKLTRDFLTLVKYIPERDFTLYNVYLHIYLNLINVSKDFNQLAYITRGSGEEIANEQAKDRRSDVRVL